MPKSERNGLPFPDVRILDVRFVRTLDFGQITKLDRFTILRVIQFFLYKMVNPIDLSEIGTFEQIIVQLSDTNFCPITERNRLAFGHFSRSN